MFSLHIIGFKLFLSMKIKLFQETQQRCSISKVPRVGMNPALQEVEKREVGMLIPYWSILQPLPTDSPQVLSSAKD